MRMRSTSAVDPTLLSSAAFVSDLKFNFSVKNLPALKFVGKKSLALSSAPPSSPSPSPSHSHSHSHVGRRALMYMATTSFLMPFPYSNSNSNSSSATATAIAIDEGSLLQEEIRKVLTKTKAAGLLRLVFHDAGTFNEGDKTGGMNGSIVYELDRPENTGLKKSVKILEKVKGQIELVRPVSWADLIAMAGSESVLICGGPKIPVRLGRVDAMVPDPEGKLPEESLDAKAMRQIFQTKGFSAQELVALSGAHTLGSKGFGSPVVFDNSYYRILLEKPWSSSDGLTSMIGLPSDRALADDDECRRWISKYAEDQNLFFEDFKKVYTKLVNAGAKWRSA